MVGFLWQIYPYGYFKAKFCLYIYINRYDLGWLGLYCISTLMGILKPNPVYTYILKYMIWFGWDLYGESTLMGIFKPNPVYTYILKYMIWFGLVYMAYQPLWVFCAKSCLHIYIKIYIIC